MTEGEIQGAERSDGAPSATACSVSVLALVFACLALSPNAAGAQILCPGGLCIADRDELTILQSTNQGHQVIPESTVPDTYDLEVRLGETVSNAGGIGITTDSFADTGIAPSAGYLLINNGTVQDGIQLNDVGAVANNGSIEGGTNPGVDIQAGEAAESLGTGISALINGEERFGTPNNDAVITTDQGAAVELNGAFLLRNRGTLDSDGGAGVLIHAGDPGGLDTGFDIDLSAIPELDGLTELPNNIENFTGATIIGSTIGVDVDEFAPPDMEAHVANDGEIFGESGEGVRIVRPDTTTGTKSDVSVVNGANDPDARIEGFTDGVSIHGPGSVTNSANILGANGTGVLMTAFDVTSTLLADDVTVTNLEGGAIHGGTSAIRITGKGDVSNFGALSGEGGGANESVVSFEDANLGGSPLDAGFANSLTNELTGTIEYGPDARAVHMRRGNDQLTNHGSISMRTLESGEVPGSVASIVAFGEGNDTLTNTGSIEAPDDSTAVRMDAGDDTVDNSGIISAPGATGVAIRMGNGEDSVTLRDGSEIIGGVFGGLGDLDELALEGTGTLVGEVDGFEDFVVGADATDWQVFGAITGHKLAVEQGILSFTDTLTLDAAFPLEVQSGATLSGTGTVTHDVTVSGIIAPGRPAEASTALMPAIATLTVGGNVDLESGSVLEIEYDAGSNDILDVGGDLRVDGGAVAFLPFPGVDGDQPTTLFLQAGGSGIADGDLEVQSSAIVNYELVFPDDDAGDSIFADQLGFRFTRNSFSELARPVHRDIAALLDSLEGDPMVVGELETAMTALSRLATPGEVDNGYGQMSPEALLSSPVIAFTAVRRQNNMLTRHLLDRRLGPMPEAPPTATSPEGEAGPTPPVGGPPPGGSDWLLTAAGYGLFANLDEDDGYDGFSGNGGGVLLGLDRDFGEHWILGGSLGTSYVRTESERYDQETNTVTPRLSLLAGFDYEGFYVDAIAGYGFSFIHSTREMSFDLLDEKAKSRHVAHEYSGYVGTGYTYQTGLWSFGPAASFQYVGLHEDSYVEDDAGSLNLQVNSEKSSSGESRIGLRGSKWFDFDDGVRFLAHAKADWAHEWIYNRHSINTRFLALDGHFRTQSTELDEDSVVVGGGIRAYLEDGVVIEFEYDLDVGRAGYMTHTFSALWTTEF